MKRLVLSIVAVLLKAAGLLFKILPLRDRVVFLSRQGSRPSLDFDLLVGRLREADPGLDVRVCVSAPETKGLLRFAGGTVAQLRLACTSRVVAVDGYIPAVSVPAKRAGTTVLQLWHAAGAIKRFGYQCLDTPDGRSSVSAETLRMHRNYDYVIAGGKWAVAGFSAAFDIDEARVLPLGLPRLEYLRAERYKPDRQAVEQRIRAAFPRLSKGRLTILYAPTFRRNDESFGASQLARACRLLEGMPVDFIFAGHPLSDGEDGLPLPENVLADTGFRSMELLCVADAMITDYSAMAYEAAAAGVPVYFYVPDIDVYRSTPGLNVDPLFEHPDCAFTDLGETLRAIVDACVPDAEGSDGDAPCEGASVRRAKLAPTSFNANLADVPDDCIGRILDLIGESLARRD